MLFSTPLKSKEMKNHKDTKREKFFVLFVSLWFLVAVWAEDPAKAQKQSEMDLLEVGKPIERELKGDQSHSYFVRMEAGQYLEAVVEQKGIDVAVTVYAPDEKKFFEIDSPNLTQGPEPVRMIAEVAGNYRLEVKPLEKGAEPGRYEVKIEELRIPTERDRDLAETERHDAEAKKLRAAGRNDEALPIIERVLAIKEKILGPSHLEVAYSLNNLASLYTAKDNYDKAEPLYQRVLAIKEKALGSDHPGVAVSLHQLASLYKAKGDYGKAELFYQRTLAIYEKVLGPDRSDVARLLNDLALLYRAKDDIAQAISYQARGNDARERAAANGNGRP
jgi:tetratricopeptide (TPR) repeat protein